MKVIDDNALAKLSAAAGMAARRRTNLNFHQTHDDPIQRMFNALAADTYVRPHRHTGAWELFVHIRGQAVLLTFSEDGTVVERFDLGDGETKAMEIPAGTWHSVAALTDDTIIMEVKAGPYRPNPAEDFAPWSPPEGKASVPEVTAWMKGATSGRRFPTPESET